MMTYEAAKQLFDGAGLPLTESHFAQFQCYLAELTETNRHMNLTAITEPAEAWEKHFLDCAILLQKVQLPLGATCIDVGTGAGFPGMVLALLRPDLQVTLLDSLQKRIGFLEQTAAKLGLANVRCIHARAEDGAKLPELREQFDMATARAVAAMPVLTEYCLPFVKQGGVFAAMKGPSETAEQAETAAKLLGGEIAEDVAAYYVESEQVPSACGLGVLIDRDRSVLTAGGYLIQLLPGAGEDVITKVEGGIYAAPSVTNLLKENPDPAVLLKTVLSDFDMEILSVDPIEYRCYCSRERTERALLSLGSKELEKIVDEQGSAELTCQFCDRVQNFTKEDLTAMIADLKKQGK